MDKANDELGAKYYKDTSYGRNINTKYLTDGLSVNGYPAKQLFVYGDKDSASRSLGMYPIVKGVEYRALGYTMYGKPFPNPNFPNDFNPGDGSGNTRWYTVDELTQGSSTLNSNHGTITGWLGALDKRVYPCSGMVGDDKFAPDNFASLHPELNRRARLAPGDKNYLDLADIAYVLQPPTEDSWGLVVFFHATPGVGSGVLYATAMMKPGSLEEEPEPDAAVDTAGSDIVVDYNILEKAVKFPLGESTATLRLPMGSWSGNATGTIDASNGSPQVYRGFSVSGNTVNEASATVRKNPDIHVTINRADFGDDPLNRRYGATISKNGVAAASGNTVERGYTYTDEDGKRQSGTASASFNSITNTKKVTVLVYNGMARVPEPSLRNEISGSGAASFTKTFAWASKPIEMDVVRMMYNQDEEGRLRDETPVPGRYKRPFKAQNEGSITWEAPSAGAMAAEYKADREKARRRDYNITGMEKAVFASDLSYKDVGWPIRSGYCFNPAGTYALTLTTKIYKGSPDATTEHEAMVEELVKSFRYGSSMAYINSSRQAVSLSGRGISKSGTAYGIVQEADGNRVGVGDGALFTVKDERSHSVDAAEELRHSYTEAGTDARFKAVLEGYAESGTAASKSSYKYVEFPEEGVEVYRVTETTKVTIKVNPDNKKVYTHAQMKNGLRTVRAWAEDLPMGPLTYGNLTAALRGPELDRLEADVKGSMYDDVN